ncbi:MAG: nuclear transport factor 2 family protein [Bacteroidota bacterium]
MKNLNQVTIAILSVLSLIWLFIIFSTVQLHAKPTTGEKDKESIIQLINKLYSSVDQLKWDEAMDVMADSVYVNYSALGGESGFQTPNEIITSWKALLPGFEATIHQTHNEAIWVAGNRASATLDAIATHYLEVSEGKNYWTVFVGYDTEFIKTGNDWKLARIDLSLYDQKGNENLPQKAMERVAQGKTRASTNKSFAQAQMEAFFDALEAQNLDALLSALSQDVVQDMPFAPANFPKSLNGIDRMKAQYTGVMNYDQKYERAYISTSNPNVVLVKFNGTITTKEGRPYNNSYVNIVEVNEDGKIKHIVEHFNPEILLNSWPGLSPETYSVHKAGARTNSGVELRKIEFESDGATLTGHLFLPPNFDPEKKYPGIVVTGSWTSVKEQMPDEYASLIAQKGNITLTFDFTGFGESEGEIRQFEDYSLKINDIKSAITFLTQHKNVDNETITGLGVCASSGYMAHATAQDERIKKLVLVAPWLHNPEIARSIYDLRPGGTDGLLASAAQAKETYEKTGEVEFVLAASELDPYSAMYVPQNAFDYYLNPAKAAGPAYDNRFAVMSWEPWLNFDGISSANEISQPVLIVHSESGAVPQGAKAFYELLDSEKEIVWLNEYDQQQLYFHEDAVNAAMDEVVNYLNK